MKVIKLPGSSRQPGRGGSGNKKPDGLHQRTLHLRDGYPHLFFYTVSHKAEWEYRYTHHPQRTDISIISDISTMPHWVGGWMVGVHWIHHALYTIFAGKDTMLQL